MNRIFKICVLISFLVIADQMTKAYFQQTYYLGQSIPVIPGLFNFTYIHNKGAAFGLGQGASDWVRMILLKILPVLVCFYLLYAICKFRHQKDKALLSWAYGSILGGATGNLIDRFSMDYVVDFLDFYYGRHHFPAFNIADSAITVAFFLLMLDLFLEERKKRRTLLATHPPKNSLD